MLWSHGSARLWVVTADLGWFGLPSGGYRRPLCGVRPSPRSCRGTVLSLLDSHPGHARPPEAASLSTKRFPTLRDGLAVTPRHACHDVARTATVWGTMTQIGAIGGAAVAGCRGGSGVGARALGGAGLLACGVCRAAHQYSNRTHLRFLPVSPSSPESEKTLCAIAWPVGVRPLSPTAPRRTGRSEPTAARTVTRDSVPRAP